MVTEAMDEDHGARDDCKESHEEENKKHSSQTNGTTIFVGNLPFETRNEQLEKEFSEIGPIKRAFVVKDKDKRSRSRGCGYVQFVLQEDADKCVKATKTIGNRKLRLNYADKKPKHLKRKALAKKEEDESRDAEDTEGKETIEVDNDNCMKKNPTSNKVIKKSNTDSNETSEPSEEVKSDGKTDIQKTIVLTGLKERVKRKAFRILCEEFGEIDKIVYPVPEREVVTAFVRFKEYKSAIRATQKIPGRKVRKSGFLAACLLTKENKYPSKKTLQRSRLIIRNLNFKCEDDDLREEFSKFGNVLNVNIPTKTVNGKDVKLGCAFVQFANSENAKVALAEMNLKEIKGRQVVVDWAVSKEIYKEKISEVTAKTESKGNEDDDKTHKKKKKVKENDEDDITDTMKNMSIENNEETIQKKARKKKKKNVDENNDEETPSENKKLIGDNKETTKKKKKKKVKECNEDVLETKKKKKMKDNEKEGPSGENKKSIENNDKTIQKKKKIKGSIVSSAKDDDQSNADKVSEEEELASDLGDDDDDDDDENCGDHRGDNDDDGSDDDDYSGNDNYEDEKSDMEGVDEKPKRQMKDAKEGKTIFIRNLSYDVDEDILTEEFEKYGEIDYCKLVYDHESGRSKGTAFIKFKQKHSADDCMQEFTKKEKLGVNIVIDGRPIMVSLAVTKGKLGEIQRVKSESKKESDKRNIYLAAEGIITRNSPAAEGLSDADLKKREKALAEKKAKLKNPNFFVSRTRLCVRNLPLSTDADDLRVAFMKHVPGQMNLRELKIMRSKERRDISGIPRSLGYGFIELESHEDALALLRATNNNPNVFGENRRPIVEFSVENAKALKILDLKKKRLELKTMSMSENNEENKIEDKKTTKDKIYDKKKKRFARYKRKREEKKLLRNNEESNKIGSTVSSKNNEKTGKISHAKKNEGTAVQSEENIVQQTSSRGFKRKLPSVLDKPMKRQRKVGKKKDENEEEKFNLMVKQYKQKLFGDTSQPAKKKNDNRWFQ